MSEYVHDSFLDMARGHCHAAEVLFKESGKDDLLVNYAGYHLQQAVELAILHEFEAQGASEVPETHDIMLLIQFAVQQQLPLVVSDYVDEHSEMLTSWRSETRYTKNYRLEPRKLKRALKEIPAFLDAVGEAYPHTLTAEDHPV